MADKIRAVYGQYSKAWLISGEGKAHLTSDDDIIAKDNTEILEQRIVSQVDKTDNVTAICQICHEFIGEIAAQRETYSRHILEQTKLLETSLTQISTIISKINQ